MAGHEGISFEELVSIVDEKTEMVKGKIRDLRDAGDDISIGEMFEMQRMMNMLAQLSEMATQVVGATHGALIAVARNVK